MHSNVNNNDNYILKNVFEYKDLIIIIIIKMSLKYPIIGLVGKRRVGKDTVAKYLVNYGYTDRKFTAPLKNCLKSLFGFTDEQIEGELKEVIDPKWGVSPRKVMQYFGTDIIQYQLPTIIPTIQRDFFVKRLFDDVTPQTLPFTISDVRFEHEAKVIKEHGGILIRIERNNNTNNETDNHISEKEQNDIKCDYIIQNDSDLISLNIKITDIINDYINLVSINEIKPIVTVNINSSKAVTNIPKLLFNLFVPVLTGLLLSQTIISVSVLLYKKSNTIIPT